MYPRLLIQQITRSLEAHEIPLCLWTYLSYEAALADLHATRTVSLGLSHHTLSSLNDALNSWIDHHVMPEFTRFLNQYHGTAHPQAFWAILIKPWMGLMVNTIYYYYLVLKKVVSEHPKLDVSLMHLTDSFEFKDTFAFMGKGHQESTLHTVMISEVIKHCFQAHFKAISDEPFTPEKHISEMPKESFNDYRSRRCLAIHSTPDAYEYLLSLLLTLKPAIRSARPDHTTLPPMPYPDMPKALEKAIFKLLHATMPLSFTTFYSHYQKKAEKITYKRGKIRLFGAVSSHVDSLKYYLANAKEKGEILITMQHGGNYGWHLSHREPQLFEHRFDYFFSWGWTQNDDRYATIIPLPVPYLRQMKDAHRFKAEHMILVGTDINPFLNTCIPAFHEGLKSLTYRDDKRLFLETLSPDLQKKMLYRGYPHKKNRFSDTAYVQKHCPEVALLEGNKKTFFKQLFQTKLCVLDHLGTTLLICLAANVPFICYWRESYCDLNDTGQSAIDRLKKEKLYFDSPTEAAAFINTIANVEVWWQQKQPLRQALLQECARTQPWLLEWMKTLWNLK